MGNPEKPRMSLYWMSLSVCSFVRYIEYIHNMPAYSLNGEEIYPTNSNNESGANSLGANSLISGKGQKVRDKT